MSNNNNIVDDTKGKISVVNDGVGMLERVINVVKNNSFWTIVKSFIFMLFFGLLLFFFAQPTYFF